MDSRTSKRLPAKENETDMPTRRSQRLLQNNNAGDAEGVLPPEKLFKPKQLPFIQYTGAIKYYTEGNEIAEASDFIMQWVDKQVEAEIVPLSFDMEWPFTFQTGSGKSATIQICVEETCCYIFQLSKLKKLPAALVALLKHPKVRPHGVNIKNDFRKLARDFPEVNADVLVEKCIELGVWCNEVCETGGRWSLERLANYIVNCGIDKNKKVRMSKWDVIPLDGNQLMYAAIDVYIGLLIYRELERREQVKRKNEEKFKQLNGETAFKAMKALGEKFLDSIDETTTKA